MAKTAITANGQTSGGNNLIALGNAMRTVRSLTSDTVKLMENMQVGSDVTMLETQYGLETGKGAAVYSTLVALNAAIAAGTDFNLVCDNLIPLK